MKLVQAGTLAAIVACSAAVFAQGPGPRRDGNWDVTIEMQMPNMPNMPQGMTIRPSSRYRKEQAADPSKAMPTPPQRSAGPAPDCKVGATRPWATR